MASVFISYSSKDRDKAAALAAALGDYGLEVWWDNNLRGGENFQDKIDEHLTNAHAVIVLLTEHALESSWVRSEVQVGVRHKNLIPVRFVRGLRPFEEIKDLHAEYFGDWDGKGRATPIANLVQRINDLKSLKDRDDVLGLIPLGLGDKLKRSSLVGTLFDFSLHGGLRVRTLALGGLVCALILWGALFLTAPPTMNVPIDGPAYLVILILVVLSRCFDQFVTVSTGGHADRFFDHSFSASLLVSGLLSLILVLGNALFMLLRSDALLDIAMLAFLTFGLTIVGLALSSTVRALIAAGRILHRRI